MKPTLRNVLIAASLVVFAAGTSGCKRADTTSGDTGSTGMSNSASAPAAAGVVGASGVSGASQ
ncbi:hypothetical protein SAMN05192564_104104 [Paraburkholderia sartisoli]|uniref:Uncharacterized protein n=1 Tax=Paraburkholderia sartisoli TaxID=83784 RepID=A0A1H4F5B7_9BURK|nr:hypothetical protein SAMN05192564_104104 [Paraburkholderia sartisoli]